MTRAPATAKKTLSEANLARFGAERLAALLMEAAGADPALKRRLRFELAAEAGAAHLALELDKRLNTLAQSKARISWRKRPDLLRELETLRLLIVERLAAEDPRLGLDRLVAWFDLYAPLSARTKDPKGELSGLFDTATTDLTEVASRAGADVAAPVLLEALSTRIAQWASFVGRGVSGLSPELSRALLAGLGGESKGKTGLLVRKIADHLGDLDAWMATLSAEDRRKSEVGAEIARRLALAARAGEAREALEAARSAPPGRKLWGGKAETPLIPDAWHEAEVAVLDAEGRTDEARDARWALFERTLSPDVLKTILAGMADFDDVIATDRAVAYAQGYFDLNQGLRFLMGWGALREAAQAITARRGELRGGYDDVPLWASRLSGRWPLAAVLLWRARAEALSRLGMGGTEEMLTLLSEAEAFAARLPDDAGIEPHDLFVRNLPRR